MPRSSYTVVLPALLVVALAVARVASAAVTINTSELREAVTVKGIMEHEEAFQALADANGDTRASGTPGYETSVKYVAGKLRDARYDVDVRKFDYELFIEQSEPVLVPTVPDRLAYSPGEDFNTMDYLGSGDVTAPLDAAGGITIPSPGGSPSGCSEGDFVGFTLGSIAPIQRGTCTFR